MQQNYMNPCTMYFPLPEQSKMIGSMGPCRIEFKPVHGGENVWIHLIENHDGIIFSDGQFTSGQKHWSTSVKEWLIACDERQHTPKFDFTDDWPAAASTEDGKSPLLVHLDYGDGRHGYVLYRVPAERLDEAKTITAAAWSAYDGSGRRGHVEEVFEDTFRRAGIPFACEACEIHRILA